MECSKLFRTLRFLLCPSRQRKPQKHSIKSAGDFEKVGNRIVAIASINNCKRRKLKTKTINFSRQVYSSNFILSSLFAYSNC